MAVEPLPTGDARAVPAPRRVGESLDQLLRHLGGAQSSTVAGVFQRWEEVVGARIAGHTRPVAVRAGALVIAVDDPAWASEIRWLGDELTAKARRVLEDASIVRIDVRVRPATG